MKLLCIESPDEWKLIAFLFGGTFPEVGDECTVKETRRCSCGKHDVYLLEEYHIGTGFQPECFATLPGVDAEEISVTEKEAIVPNPNL